MPKQKQSRQQSGFPRGSLLFDGSQQYTWLKLPCSSGGHALSVTRSPTMTSPYFRDWCKLINLVPDDTVDCAAAETHRALKIMMMVVVRLGKDANVCSPYREHG